MPHDPNARTHTGKHSMAEWWGLSASAERAAVNAYRPLIQKGDLVFDIGANRGRKTMIFRWLGAKVIAVEPLARWGDEFVPELFWKFGDDGQVIIVPRAVAAERVVTMRIQKNILYLSSMDREWMTKSAHAFYYPDQACIERKVQAVTLDGLIGIYGIPQFIKIDVEGAENTVARTLTQPVNGLNMEYHQDWIPTTAMAHIDTLGTYDWNYTLNNRGEFMAPEWMDSRRLLEWMRPRLTPKGPGSWGDVYARLRDATW